MTQMADILFGFGIGAALIGGIALGFFFGWLYLRGKLQQWKSENERAIRADAIERSGSVTLGKVTEHFAPYFSEFLSKYNPRDARFLGTPIDLVVFDGLDEGNLGKIVFVEVKTGASSLNQRERQVRAVVKAKEVYWDEIKKFADEGSPSLSP